MRRDVVPGAPRQLLQEVRDVARNEVVHHPAARADDVMVVSGSGQPVLNSAVVQDHLADRTHRLEQPQRPEHRRTTDTRRRSRKPLCAEMIAKGVQRLQQHVSGRCHPMPLAGEVAFENLDVHHAFIVGRAARPVNDHANVAYPETTPPRRTHIGQNGAMNRIRAGKAITR